MSQQLRNASGLHYYRIPKDGDLRKQYVRLIRNKTLKLDSDNTRICSKHFEGGKKLNRKQLPSIFPWTIKTDKRRELKRVELPRKTREYDQGNASLSSVMVTTTTTEVSLHEDIGLEMGISTDMLVDQSLFIDVGTQTEEIVVDQSPFYMNMETQTEESYLTLLTELDEYQRKIESLTNELKQLKVKLDISFYTGFYDFETLMLCYSIVEESSKNMNYGSYTKLTDDNKLGRPRKLSCFEEFTLVLMKLRLGLFNHDLAHRFDVSESSVSLIFRTWIRLLRSELEPLIILPPRDVLKVQMPPLFKEHYPRTALIIDCTEFEMERPSSLDNQSVCYSQYKSRTTMKCLIGITPSGVTAFVSELYPGSISDKEIVKKSGLLQVLQAGDEIMADKGFLIKDELVSVGARLVMPSFLKARKQFTKEEAELNKKVACLRVHVERCMERIRNWHILDGRIPVTY